MSDISKIKVGGTSHNIKDKPLTERVNTIDEVVANALADHEERTSLIEEIAATALNQLNDSVNIGPLTTSEIDAMFAEKEEFVIYTENFEDGKYDPDGWAEENGYSDFAEMAADYTGDAWIELGSQKLTNSGETFEYDGQTYQIWNNETDGGESNTFGLMPMGITKAEIEANSLKVDSESRYSPFIGKIQNDDFYGEIEEGQWCVLEVV